MTTPSLLGSFSRAQTTYPGGTPTYNSYTDTLPAGTNRVAIIRVARSKFNSVWSGATATVDLGGGPITATYIAKTASSYATEEVAWQCALGTSGSAQSSTWKIQWGVNTETIGAFSIEVWGNVDQTTPVASSADDHATSTAFSSSATCPADSACSAGVTGNFTAEVAGTGVTVALSQISTGTSSYKHAVAYRIGAAPSLTLTAAAVFSALSIVLSPDAPPASGDLNGNVTLADVTAAGTLASSSSDLSGGVTLSDVVAAGTLGATPAGWSVPALTNWSGTLQASVTIPVVTFQRLSDGVQVLVLTSQTTNGAGTLSGTSGSLSTGTTYMACGWNADGSQRFAVPVTAT